MSRSCLSVGLFLGLLAPSFQPLAAAEFHFDKASLRSEATEYQRVRVQSPWRGQHRVGKRRIVIDGQTVIELASEIDREVRRVRSPDGANLLWLAAVDEVACFAVGPAAQRLWGGELQPPIVHRLDLNTMRWLPPLQFDTGGPVDRHKPAKGQVNPSADKPGTRPDDIQQKTVLGAVATCDQSIVLLLYHVEVGKIHWPEVNGYRVVCIEPRSGKTRWTTSLAWQGKEHYLPPEAIYTISDSQDPVSPRPQRIQLLATVRDSILVCPGTQQDLVCLWAESGKERWRTARIWEFQRNAGDHIDRFGAGLGSEAPDRAMSPPDGEDNPSLRKAADDAKKQLAAEKDAFYRLHDGWIAAGPAVTRNARSQVFLAVARGHKDDSREQAKVMESLIYEIDPDGRIQSMSAVPREVVGRPCTAGDDSVVWGCGSESLIRVASSWSRPTGHSDAGGLAFIDWFRQIPIRAPQRLQPVEADPPQGITGCTDKWLLRAGGAYLVNWSEQVLRFPIDVIDFATGVQRARLTLAIPFDGSLPPSQNGFLMSGPFGPMPQAPWREKLLTIRGLQIEGHVLRVVTELDDVHSITALEFDLKSLLADGAACDNAGVQDRGLRYLRFLSRRDVSHLQKRVYEQLARLHRECFCGMKYSLGGFGFGSELGAFEVGSGGMGGFGGGPEDGPMRALYRMGVDALPTLVEALDDDTPTERSYVDGRTGKGRFSVRVNELVAGLIDEIVEKRFDISIGGPPTELETHPERIPELKKRVLDWYAANGKKTLAERKIANLDRDDWPSRLRAIKWIVANKKAVSQKLLIGRVVPMLTDRIDCDLKLVEKRKDAVHETYELVYCAEVLGQIGDPKAAGHVRRVCEEARHVIDTYHWFQASDVFRAYKALALLGAKDEAVTGLKRWYKAGASKMTEDDRREFDNLLEEAKKW